LARASPRTLNLDPNRRAIEQSWTLVGARRGRIWYARRVYHHRGSVTSVRFDGLAVLRREEARGDVLGFFHTHPDGPPRPSARDVRTMRAWCSSFGKPLLCVIASPGGLAGFRFDGGEGKSSGGLPLATIEVFPRGVVIGVEADGG
jgi:proteasome lid subunit RPN8/RPN11